MMLSVPARIQRVASWIRRPAALGLLGVGFLAVVYPPFADVTQHPLGIFVVPILIVSVLGTWGESAVVGLVAMTVAGVIGAVGSGFDATGLVARLTVMGVCWLLAMVLTYERGRRQQVLDDSLSRGVLMDAFQDSLVPEPVPPAGVVVDTRYLPGDERLMLGGDFFDAIRLPNGSLGYIIGDVCGHGPRAAAFGAAVRSGWKALATTVPEDPLHWVQGLDETFFRLGRHADTFVTLNTGYIHLGGEGQWCFVSAGHPWPILLRPDLAVDKPNVGPPLGVGISTGWKPTYRTLGPGSTVFMYTDGLIENPLPRRGRPNDGEQQLLEYLRAGPLDIDDLLTTFGPEGFDDDVAVMSITITSEGGRGPTVTR